MADRGARHDDRQPGRGQGRKPGQDMDGWRHDQADRRGDFGDADELAEGWVKRGPRPAAPPHSPGHELEPHGKEQPMEQKDEREEDLQHPSSRVQTAPSSGGKVFNLEGAPSHLLMLQRLAGNEAVTEFLSRPSVDVSPKSAAGRSTSHPIQVSRAAPSSAAAVEAKTDNTQVALDAINIFYLQAAAKKDSLEGALYSFISVAYGHGLMVALREMGRALGGRRDVPAIKAALEQFRITRGDELIKRLVAEPNGLETWKKVQTDNAGDLRGESGDQYVERVEAKLLPTYALAEAKKTGKAPKKLQQIADVQIRPMIIEDLNMMVQGATQAVGVWSGLRRSTRKHQHSWKVARQARTSRWRPRKSCLRKRA
jgi:hypothetical protein